MSRLEPLPADSMDLVFPIGGYCLLDMAVNTFGVQKETT